MKRDDNPTYIEFESKFLEAKGMIDDWNFEREGGVVRHDWPHPDLRRDDDPSSKLFWDFPSADLKYVAELLDEGADPNKVINGVTAFQMYATFREEPEMIALLIERGGDVNAVSADGATALIGAITCNNADEVIKLLLEKGADPNAADREGNTALHFAAMQGNLNYVKLLMAHGADAHARNKKYLEPAVLATQKNVDGKLTEMVFMMHNPYMAKPDEKEVPSEKTEQKQAKAESKAPETEKEKQLNELSRKLGTLRRITNALDHHKMCIGLAVKNPFFSKAEEEEYQAEETVRRLANGVAGDIQTIKTETLRTIKDLGWICGLNRELLEAPSVSIIAKFPKHLQSFIASAMEIVRMPGVNTEEMLNGGGFLRDTAKFAGLVKLNPAVIDEQRAKIAKMTESTEQSHANYAAEIKRVEKEVRILSGKGPRPTQAWNRIAAWQRGSARRAAEEAKGKPVVG